MGKCIEDFGVDREGRGRLGRPESRWRIILKEIYRALIEGPERNRLAQWRVFLNKILNHLVL
jgi:hypothetical protein